MKKLVFLLSLALLTSCFLLAQQVNEIEKVFSALNQKGRFSGNILIAEKGEVVFEKSFGFSNRSKKIPLRANNIFNIASVSKTITAIATMQLVEQGLLCLDDDITTYLTDLPYINITVKHLLSHTSGLPKVQIQPFRKEISRKGYTNKEILRTYARIAPKPYFDSGADYNYANTNYIFLALIIEKVSGKDFNAFLKHNIFDVCKMKETHLFERRVPQQFKERVVDYYRKPNWLSDRFQNVDSLAENIEDAATFDEVYGASSIHTTARDLLKFHNALQNGTLLSNRSLQKMYNPLQLSNKLAYTIDAASNYTSLLGLGWKIAQDSTKGKIVYHAGGFQGGRSFFIRNIEKDQCVIILTNNEETDRYTFTSPMRILNEASYQLDKISLPRLFSNEYLKNGINSALERYRKYEKEDDYTSFISWDFEEIGTELLETKDYEAAIRVFELYTIKFPDEYSWSMLGDAYLLFGNKLKALKCFKQSLAHNSEFEHSRQAVHEIENE